jgi:hypothetical protein
MWPLFCSLWFAKFDYGVSWNSAGSWCAPSFGAHAGVVTIRASQELVNTLHLCKSCNCCTSHSCDCVVLTQQLVLRAGDAWVLRAHIVDASGSTCWTPCSIKLSVIGLIATYRGKHLHRGMCVWKWSSFCQHEVSKLEFIRAESTCSWVVAQFCFSPGKIQMTYSMLWIPIGHPLIFLLDSSECLCSLLFEPFEPHDCWHCLAALWVNFKVCPWAWWYSSVSNAWSNLECIFWCMWSIGSNFLMRESWGSEFVF